MDDMLKTKDEYPTDDTETWTPPELFDSYTRGSEEQWARADSDGLLKRVVSNPLVTPRTDEYPTLSNTQGESTKNALMVKEEVVLAVIESVPAFELLPDFNSSSLIGGTGDRRWW
ncbi:hypothetical protein GCK32_014824 [Trichostrongylus colubriformis]|uniref:Uncharacterized protein n=1 Tax=Trichostrongylus colubriformis TaxID=6319 RepID=A0AAN8FZS3_TRICO